MMVIYVQIYEPKALRVSQLLKIWVEINDAIRVFNSFVHLTHILYARHCNRYWEQRIEKIMSSHSLQPSKVIKKSLY